MDLFDLAMVDTLRAYPRLSIQPFRDMIAGKYSFFFAIEIHWSILIPFHFLICIAGVFVDWMKGHQIRRYASQSIYELHEYCIISSTSEYYES